jgi:hypothetical protein
MLIYMTHNIFNGHDLSSKNQMMEIIVPASCQPINRVVPMPALRAEVAAQARHYHRAVPCLDCVFLVSCSDRPIVLVQDGNLYSSNYYYSSADGRGRGQETNSHPSLVSHCLLKLN